MYSGKFYFEESSFKLIDNDTFDTLNERCLDNLTYKTIRKETREASNTKAIRNFERIILVPTKENDLILDPFCGSNTTEIAANKLNRRYIGIDNSKEYLDLSIRRYEEIKGVLYE